jgi:hypothetical protein
MENAPERGHFPARLSEPRVMKKSVSPVSLLHFRFFCQAFFVIVGRICNPSEAAAAFGAVHLIGAQYFSP